MDSKMSTMELNDKELEKAAGGAFAPLPEKTGYRVHTVELGETLADIARKYGITEEQIKSWNNQLKSKQTLYCGEPLYIRRG